MVRRFVCTGCGTKWFIPAGRSDAPDLTECGACGGPLTAFVEGNQPAVMTSSDSISSTYSPG